MRVAAIITLLIIALFAASASSNAQATLSRQTALPVTVATH